MNYSVKTKPWLITLTVATLVLLYFLLVWLLVGEIDILGKHWIVPFHGTLWHGKITENIIPSLIAKYGPNGTVIDCGITVEGLEQHIGDNMRIVCPTMLFNPIILVFVFTGLVIAIAYPFILKLLKIGNFDILPFSITAAVFCIIFMISDLITYWGQDNDFWRDVIRLLIACICSLITFIIVNRICNYFYITNNSAQHLANELKQEKRNADIYNNEFKELVDNYHKNNDQETIELDDITKK